MFKDFKADLWNGCSDAKAVAEKWVEVNLAILPCSWLNILGKRYVNCAEYPIGFQDSPLTNSTFCSPSLTYLIPSIIPPQQLSTIYRTMDITICVGQWMIAQSQGSGWGWSSRGVIGLRLQGGKEEAERPTKEVEQSRVLLASNWELHSSRFNWPRRGWRYWCDRETMMGEGKEYFISILYYRRSVVRAWAFCMDLNHFSHQVAANEILLP